VQYLVKIDGHRLYSILIFESLKKPFTIKVYPKLLFFCLTAVSAYSIREEALKPFGSGRVWGWRMVSTIPLLTEEEPHGPSLSVTAAYLPVLNLYQQHFGGEIRRRRKSANKQLWVWITIRYDECRYFLETISPLLMEKTDQAQLLLQFIQVRGAHPMFRPPPEVRQFSHEIAKQIAALKHVNFP
jgi:hypothetical protein